MSRKYGLGKGLGALIPEKEEVRTENKDKVKEIDINLVKPNKGQPRKNFDSQKIMELAESIKQHGIIQPVILQQKDECYSIIAGERRWRAAKSIGLKNIPSIIVDMTEKQILEVSLIENIQREDLNPIEEAIAYEKLLTEFDITQEELSKRLGKSRTSITNCKRLLNLDNRVKQYLIDGVISEGHGRALLSIEDGDIQYSIAQTIIDEKLSVRELEKLIKSINNNTIKKKSKNKVEDSPYYVHLKNQLEDYLGTKVFIKNKDKKGKIEIEYYSEEDLQRIIEILNINN